MASIEAAGGMCPLGGHAEEKEGNGEEKAAAFKPIPFDWLC
jgi:hypothetical protein